MREEVDEEMRGPVSVADGSEEGRYTSLMNDVAAVNVERVIALTGLSAGQRAVAFAGLARRSLPDAGI